MRKLTRSLMAMALAVVMAQPASARTGVAEGRDPETGLPPRPPALPITADPELGLGGRYGQKKNQGDNLQTPLSARQFQNRQNTLKQKINNRLAARSNQAGEAAAGESDEPKGDRIFVILAQFGDQVHPVFGDPTVNPGGNVPGPLHNQIPKPRRAEDNSTLWKSDFNAEYYNDMYFNNMLAYYLNQSSGQYYFSGKVVDWVRVPYNAARYGHDLCGSVVCSSVWFLLKDAINIWTADQLASGKTPEEIEEYLQEFDIQDRYDFDGDGDLAEPDGYIDHFQIVHAGAGEETGGGAQGANAIWSHRWYAFSNDIGVAGPVNNKLGGIQFGSLNMWAGDYTIQPENGGLGVFAHEYAHDLGLPDQYDTAGGDNSTGFWTIMSSGSYLGNGRFDIGSRPGDFNAWEKLQLGWLDWVGITDDGKTTTMTLGPAEGHSSKPQAVVVRLPYKQKVLTLASPIEGSYAWWSGKGNSLNTSMMRSVSVPSEAPTLNMQVWYDAEQDFDYGYVSVSTDGGATWTNLASAITTTEDPNGINRGNGITGSSEGWVAATFDLAAYAGQTVLLRLQYVTDGAVEGKGFLFDQITLGSFSDGAENGANGWTLNEFTASTGQVISWHWNAYIGEFRQYRNYDKGLQTGPYNFGFLNTLPDFVEHYPYQDGLLLSYWDESNSDNNTSEHPGEGLILPIDSHPTPLVRPNGTFWRSRIQGYDSTFTLEGTDAITLHVNGAPLSIPSLPGVPLFNDRNDYWSASTPLAGVNVPKTGATIEIVSLSPSKKNMKIKIKAAG